MIPKKSGIYRLYDKNKILIYIGRSLSLARRLSEHSFSKEFSYFTIEPVDVGLAILEKKYLEDYRNMYNGNLPMLNMQLG
ncbi:GIY-YIG nuclease family protein [Candidatus Woesearchaeota archaeon]|nr:GIY-YIG nuclease family protein [Candidatus Woesearchaeota archaeon]